MRERNGLIYRLIRWFTWDRTADLTNEQVMEYLWRTKENQELKEIERNRRSLSWRRLLFYGRGTVLPFNRKEEASHRQNKRAGQGCA